MSLVIVSSYCYLLCEAVNHISVDICGEDEHADAKELSWETRSKSKAKKVKKAKRPTSYEKRMAAKRKEAFYQVTINFAPINRNNSGGGMIGGKGGGDERSLYIIVQGHDVAQSLYHEIVHQIREQLPDQLFLDGLVNRLLGGEEK